jgi:metal-responsive CopG/Arc/MetJ family transcriptional regulator
MSNKSKAERVAELTRNRNRLVSVRLNEELVRLLDEAISKDSDLSSRNEFFERCVLRYLEEKGKL